MDIAYAGLGAAVVGILTTVITIVWIRLSTRKRHQLAREVSEYLNGQR